MPRRSETPVNLSHPPSAHRHDHEKTKERYIIIVDKRYETFVFPFKHSMKKMEKYNENYTFWKDNVYPKFM